MQKAAPLAKIRSDPHWHTLCHGGTAKEGSAGAESVAQRVSTLHDRWRADGVIDSPFTALQRCRRAQECPQPDADLDPAHLERLLAGSPEGRGQQLNTLFDWEVCAAREDGPSGAEPLAAPKVGTAKKGRKASRPKGGSPKQAELSANDKRRAWLLSKLRAGRERKLQVEKEKEESANKEQERLAAAKASERGGGLGNGEEALWEPEAIGKHADEGLPSPKPFVVQSRVGEAEGQEIVAGRSLVPPPQPSSPSLDNGGTQAELQEAVRRSDGGQKRKHQDIDDEPADETWEPEAETERGQRRTRRGKRKGREQGTVASVCFDVLTRRFCPKQCCPYRHPARPPKVAAQNMCLRHVSGFCKYRAADCQRYHWTRAEELEYLESGELPAAAIRSLQPSKTVRVQPDSGSPSSDRSLPVPLSPPICHKTCRPEFPALEEIKSPKYGPSEFGFADLEDAGEIPMMLPLRGDAPCHQESNSGARSVGGKLDVREGLGGPLQRTVLPGRRSVALAVQSFDSANGNATRGLPAGVNRGVKRPVGRAWPTGLFALEKAAVQSLEEDGGHDGVRSGGDTAQGAAQSSEQAHGGKVQSAGAFSGAPSGLKMGRRERGGSVGLEHQSGQSQGDGHIGDVDERNEGIEGGERKAASSAHGVTTFTIVTGGDHTVLGSNAPAQEKQGEVFNYLRAVQKRAAAGRAGPQGTGEGGQKWEADEGGAGMQKAPPVRAVKRAALVSSSLGVLRDASIEPGEARLEIRSPGQRSGEAGADTEVTRKVSAEQEKQRSDPGWVCLKLEPTELGTRGDGTGTLLRTAAIAEAAATLAKRNGPSDLLTPSDSVDVAETCMFSVADTASAYREPKGVRPLSELGDVFEEGGDLAEAANGERKSSVKRRAPLVSWPQFGSPVKRPKEAKLKPKPGVVSYVQPERKTLAAGAIEGVIPKGVNVSELTAAVVERARAASVAEIGAKVRETEAEAQFWDLPSPVRPLPQRGAANGGPAERSTVALDGAEAGKGAAERGAADVSKKRRFAGPEELDPAEVERPETGTKVGPVGNGKLIETGAVAPEKNSVSEWLVGRIPARRETRRKKPVDGTSGSGAKESAGGAFSKIGSPVAASNGALESAAGVEQGDGARNGDNQGLSDLEESERYNRTSARVRMLRELLADRQKDSAEAEPSSIEPPEYCPESASVSKLRLDLNAARAQLEREQKKAQRSLEEQTREREQIAAERAALEKDKQGLERKRKELEEKERNGGGTGECISCMEDWGEGTVRQHFACGHALMCRKCSLEWLSKQRKPPYKCSVGCDLKKCKTIKPVYLG